MPATAKVLNFLKQCTGFEKVMEKVIIRTAGSGSCVGELKLGKEHTNILGGLHGGLSATLVDVISSVGLLTHKNGECPHVSVNLSLSYLKSAKIDDTILIEAKTLKAGKNLAFLEVEIKNKETGDLLVKGSHTKYLLQVK